MAERRRVVVLGRYALPAAIALTAGAFGRNVRVAIGQLPGTLLLPRLVWEGERPSVVAPDYLPDDKFVSEHWDGRDNSWGRVSSWNPSTSTVALARAHAVGFRFLDRRDAIEYSEYLYGRGHPMGKSIDSIFDGIDAWFDSFRAWVEVMTEQDLDPRLPVESVWTTGAGLELLTLDDGMASLPTASNRMIATLDRPTPASLHVVRVAARLASEMSAPPEPHLLLRDARAAARRGGFRRAVIEAASALEIALAEFNDDVGARLPRRPTLGTYVANEQIAAAARLPSDLQGAVVDVRNDAIHQGRSPCPAAAWNAIAAVASVLRTIAPLPARGRQHRASRS